MSRSASLSINLLLTVCEVNNINIEEGEPMRVVELAQAGPAPLPPPSFHRPEAGCACPKATPLTPVLPPPFFSCVPPTTRLWKWSILAPLAGSWIRL
jgi:hypothetical protein